MTPPVPSQDAPTILSVGLKLASGGFAVHWLRGPSGGEEKGRGKAPIYRDWQQAPWQSPEQLRRTYVPGCNLGIHTGRVHGARCALLVVDCDDEAAVAWARAHLPRPAWKVRTRQGEHWYYFRPETEARCPNRARVGGLRLDVRCDDGNIVCPPSVHPSGFVYEIDGEFLERTYAAWTWTDPLPVFDYAWLPGSPAPAPALSVRATHKAAMSDARRERRAMGLAHKWQVSERGAGQGTDTFKLCGYLLHTLGLSPEETYRVVATHYNPRCPQPYAEPELLRKVQQAATQMRDRRPRLADERPAAGRRS